MNQWIFRRVAGLVAGLVAFAAPLSHAELTAVITGHGAKQLPIAIPDFGGERVESKALTSVVRNDLDRSGLFRIVDVPVPLSETDTPNFADLQGRGVDAIAGGGIRANDAGRLETRVRLHDIARQAVLGGQAYAHTSEQLRATGHRIADFIYEKLIGEPGNFSTRIAYVVHASGRFELQIADADGGNPQTALASREPIISPMWSPDGGKLAYVSFEAKKPVVYVHDLTTGKRHVVANFRGSNSAPAWSPDGKRLAVVLTKDGGSQLYVVNANGSGAERLATSNAIDTEPRYSPDGANIYFTSDRGGTPQIYRIPSGGGEVERVTFDGTYNVTPRVSPDGRSMAYVTRNNGRFQLALMDLATRQTTLLTDTVKDESPSFAPNGRMIIYATEVGGRGVLAAVSTDGRVKQRLSIPAADVREPTWGPRSSP